MQKLINTSALAAALAAVLVALWRDNAVLVALKRATIAYLAFYFVTALLVMAYRWGIVAETKARQAREKALQTASAGPRGSRPDAGRQPAKAGGPGADGGTESAKRESHHHTRKVER